MLRRFLRSLHLPLKWHALCNLSGVKFLAPLLSVFILCFLTMACQKGSPRAISSASSPAVLSTNEFVIGMGGDVALTRTGSLENSPLGATRDQFLTWEEMSEGLVSLTAGNEFNFMNFIRIVFISIPSNSNEKKNSIF